MVLKEYLRRAPNARAHLPVDKDAPLTNFAVVATGNPAIRE
ncbi:hypothetical protein [Saccharomonospora piscinae]|nr:hypothetical protein [Saccharomonospora piscinae]